MPVAILHISGPPHSGKTAVATALADSRQSRPPYYLRIDAARDDMPALRMTQSLLCMCDAKRIVTDPGVVFESISEAVGDIAQSDADATIIVETDNDPCFRHAYPWHVQVFAVPPPAEPRIIFRTREELAQSIREAMHDTRSFAAEMFGLEQGPGDSSILPGSDASTGILDDGDSDSVEEFLSSDVGADIACRMRLHSAYHAIIESDIVLLNEANGPWKAKAGETAQLIARLLEMTRARLDRQVRLVQCNPNDGADDRTRQCVACLSDLIEAARVDGL